MVQSAKRSIKEEVGGVGSRLIGLYMEDMPPGSVLYCFEELASPGVGR